MTRYEKITVALSMLALVGAIASPFIAYQWLDPQLQSFQNRARLEVSEIVEATEQETQPRKVTPEELVGILLRSDTYRMQISNVGKLPARDVSITLQYGSMPSNAFVGISPPILSDTLDKDNLRYVTLKQPIAPRDTLKIILRPAPDEIWVTNEYGERSSLTTGAKLQRVVQSWTLERGVQ